MTISVILPIYNAQSYLPACLDSLLAQTHKDFEIIAINDGSQDQSGAILDDYAYRDRRIKAHHFSENQGETKAMQYGIEKASRPFHARMDNDDICMPNRLERQEQWLRSHPNTTVVGSNMRFFQGGMGATKLPHLDKGIKANFLPARANIMNPTSMWRAKFFDDHQIRYGNYKNVSDFALWVDCMLAGGEFFNLPDQLLQYRIHDKQASNDTCATNQGVQIVLTKLLLNWYPQLSKEDAHCFAKICHSVGSHHITKAEITTAIHAASIAIKDSKSRFGEDRAQVIAHIHSRLNPLKEAFARHSIATSDKNAEQFEPN